MKWTVASHSSCSSEVVLWQCIDTCSLFEDVTELFLWTSDDGRVDARKVRLYALRILIIIVVEEDFVALQCAWTYLMRLHYE